MSKVFQVVTEYYPEDSKEIQETVQYVTHESNDLADVAKWSACRCGEEGSELKSVKEVLVIARHIKE